MSDAPHAGVASDTPFVASTPDLAKELLYELAEVVGDHLALPADEILGSGRAHSVAAREGHLMFLWLARAFGCASRSQLVELLGINRKTMAVRLLRAEDRVATERFERNLRPILHYVVDDVVLKRRLNRALATHRASTGGRRT